MIQPFIRLDERNTESQRGAAARTNLAKPVHRPIEREGRCRYDEAQHKASFAALARSIVADLEALPRRDV